jgi:hypothetical protein
LQGSEGRERRFVGIKKSGGGRGGLEHETGGREVVACSDRREREKESERETMNVFNSVFNPSSREGNMPLSGGGVRYVLVMYRRCESCLIVLVY